MKLRTDVTRYFFDTEFIEDGKTIDLISIGMVCSDGRSLYLVNQEADLTKASAWVREHVLPKLPHYGDEAWQPRSVIRDQVHNFVRPEKLEIWAYYADYDWVALCQLFGTMMDLPAHFPRFCMDVKQLSVLAGDVRLPKQAATEEHDALADAVWTRASFEFIRAGLDAAAALAGRADALLGSLNDKERTLVQRRTEKKGAGA